MAVMQLEGPYPTFARPSVEECWEVRNRLHSLHGLGGEYVRPRSCPTIDPIAMRDPEEVKRHTVLDSLIGTILSQNTTDNNSRRAFASLKTAFPTWEEVQKADLNAVEDAIRCGGLAQIKAARIANILNTLLEERGSICLEYVRNMTSDQIKAELSRFKGVGPKTVACVLMFHLEHNEFPVDTHVHRLSKMLGWVPPNADREKAYLHLNKRVPNDIKFDLHCLLVTHGKRCPRCAKGGRAQTTPDGPCPLVNWSFKAVQENDSKGSISLLDQNAIKFLEG
ncbi:unnamed protein product [Sphagnum troendelagicum]|uniref:HhH-GPD domain-containing protein n=1 Tax=Sphagnum troendelagicum TaxID=128251 RepID=A0ABP0TVX0_9BRYO